MLPAVAKVVATPIPVCIQEHLKCLIVGKQSYHLESLMQTTLIWIIAEFKSPFQLLFLHLENVSDSVNRECI